MFPLCAFGHGAEFLLAKLSIARSGECVLEVTADYGDNPMLLDESAARSALKSLLHIITNSGAQELNDLAQPHVERRSKPDPNAPGYQPDQDQTQEHKLLVSCWRWQPQVESFTFQIPTENPHTALLWLVDERVAESTPRWVMMIGGDTSPIIQVPQNGQRLMIWALGGALAGVMFVVRRMRKAHAAVMC